MAGFRRGYVDGRVGQIHYRIAQPTGGSTRPPLICFHMSPNSGRIYENFIADMGADRIAVAPDTPGFGDSDPPPEAPGIEDYAAAMGDLIDAFGFDTVDVMGFHTGSETSVEIALQRPDQIRRLVLVSAPIFTDEELPQFRDHYAKRDISDDGSHLAAKWRGHQVWAMDGIKLDDIAYQFADAVRRPDISWWGHSAAFSYAFADHLYEVAQPILVLNPEDDLHKQTLRAEGLMRNGRIHELPGWSHGFLDLRTAETAGIVRAFLDAD